jgi:hypothetical protein
MSNPDLSATFNCVTPRIYLARFPDRVRPKLPVNLHQVAMAAVIVKNCKISLSVL